LPDTPQSTAGAELAREEASAPNTYLEAFTIAFASKLAPTDSVIPEGVSMLAMNDSAVCLMIRVA